MSDVAGDKVRIDKWLWAARFFKTRSLAQEAVELGRVLVNGDRVKPARVLRLGDELRLRLNQLEYTIQVLGLSAVRRSAPEAQQLYREEAASIAAREAKLLQLKADRASFPHGEGRPTKKARREMVKFRAGGD